MNRRTFWTIIDRSRDNARGDPEAQIEGLKRELMQLTLDEVVDFDRIFSEYHTKAYTWPLWGAAYIIGGGCSDDGFADFRGWLISRGKRVYESLLSNPDMLVDVVDGTAENCQVEGFEYVSSETWERLTGKSADYFPSKAKVLPKEPAGEAWDENNVQQLSLRFPRLWKKYSAKHFPIESAVESGNGPESKRVMTEAFGEIMPGDEFIHAQFGRGVVEAAELMGSMVIMKMRFGEVLKHLTILKGSTYLSRAG